MSTIVRACSYVGNVMANACCGPIHLKDNAAASNVEHLANLSLSNRSHSALSKTSQAKASKGTFQPINDGICSVWEGIKQGVFVPLVATAWMALEYDAKAGIMKMDDQEFCATTHNFDKAKDLAGNAVSAVWDGIKNLSVEDINLNSASHKMQSAAKSFSSGLDEHSWSMKACKKDPTSTKCIYLFKKGWEALKEYHLPLAIVAAGISIGAVFRSYTSQQEERMQVRANLFDGLLTEYTAMGAHLTSTFKEAVASKDDAKIKECRDYAQQIQANLPKIRNEIAKCKGALTPDQQAEIVGKISEAVNDVLRAA